MHRLLIFVACLASLPAMAKNAHSAAGAGTPEGFIQHYFDVFNAQDKKGLDTIFTKPFLRITDGKTTAYSDWRDYRNYKAILATGWDRSIIDHIEVGYDAQDTAALKTLFSRLNAEGKVVATAEILFIVAKKNRAWKLAAMAVPPSLPVSKNE